LHTRRKDTIDRTIIERHLASQALATIARGLEFS
jgi:hypothetical protein